jgi:hypothetical protein
VRLGESLEAKREWLRDRIDALPDKGRSVRWGALTILLVAAIGFLVLVNWLLRGGGLWGDLAFALVLTTLVFWTLRRLLGFLFKEKEGVAALPRALAATLFALVGVPIALVNWLAGLVFLALPLVAWGGLELYRRRRKPPTHAPALWKVVLCSVGLLILFLVFQKPLTPSDLVPEPVPAAALEGSDAQLAAAFRPLLFFDSGERRYPLDIDDAIAANRIDMCRKYVITDSCPDVTSGDMIDMSFDYLDIDESAPPPRGGGDESAYYYHVVPGEGGRIFVDYWWFFSRNPSPVADQVFCGPGFRTPPFTCQEHAGDWEGITVVVAPCEEASETCVDVGGELLGPAAVRYAQHAHVLSYSFPRTLERVWESLEAPEAPALAEIWTNLVLPAVEENGVRPVVFVARNSHASYPDACLRDCVQEVGGLPEAHYDGGLPWTHNLTCDGCLRPLPLAEAGGEASWNAFPGRWGSQECILAGAYCDLSQAPRGPSFQHRYDDPADEGEWICAVESRSDDTFRLGRCGRGQEGE